MDNTECDVYSNVYLEKDRKEKLEKVYIKRKFIHSLYSGKKAVFVNYYPDNSEYVYCREVISNGVASLLNEAAELLYYSPDSLEQAITIKFTELKIAKECVSFLKKTIVTPEINVSAGVYFEFYSDRIIVKSKARSLHHLFISYIKGMVSFLVTLYAILDEQNTEPEHKSLLVEIDRYILSDTKSDNIEKIKQLFYLNYENLRNVGTPFEFAMALELFLSIGTLYKKSINMFILYTSCTDFSHTVNGFHTYIKRLITEPDFSYVLERYKNELQEIAKKYEIKTHTDNNKRAKLYSDIIKEEYISKNEILVEKIKNTIEGCKEVFSI